MYLDDIQISICGVVPVAPVLVGNFRTSFNIEADKKDKSVELSVSYHLFKDASYLYVEKFDPFTGTFEAIEDIIVDQKSNPTDQ